MTFTLENPNSANPEWPFRGIDHVPISLGSGGPSLPIRSGGGSSTRELPAPATTTDSLS